MVRSPGAAMRSLARPRRGPLRENAFTSPLHSPRTAALLGIALGIAFTLCFVTGVLSHLIQQPPGWFTWPSRPAGLYRLTQGIHVATGIASVPLLLGKLWTVYPRLWQWPPVKSPAHLLERLSLVPLVAGALFLLFTGIANISLWYPWHFFFPAAHYWASWVTMGALVVHVGAKASTVRKELWGRDPAGLQEIPSVDGGLNRRGFLGALAGAAGLLTLTTIGQTFSPLNGFAVLAPRRPDVGPQGFPVNKSALSANVTDVARDAGYRLKVGGEVEQPLSLSLDGLRALHLHEATLPISCVEGWSASVRWEGIRVRDILDLAGVAGDRSVQVVSLQPEGLYRTSVLNPVHARDRDTLLALRCNGEILHLDHGYPVRLIGPNRPGVMQTKWVSELVVL
jgi:hypothetical protein